MHFPFGYTFFIPVYAFFIFIWVYSVHLPYSLTREMLIPMATWIRQALTSVIADLGDQHLSADGVDSCLWRIEQVYRELLARKANGELDINESEALPLLAEVDRRLGRAVESCVIMPLQASVLVNGDVGRHCFIISYNQL